MEGLARAAQQNVGRFNAQDLTNTAWAFVKSSKSDTPLFAILARAAERRAGAFNTQDLANTARAFAKSCQADAKLV